MTSEDEVLAHREQRWAGAAPIWSGRVHATLAETLVQFAPGRGVDLGCGEGEDVLRLPGSARFEQCDLTVWRPAPDSCDQVTASFLPSHVALERTAILRRAAGALAVGGRLALVPHAAPPPRAREREHRGSSSPHEGMLSAEEEAAEPALPAESWEVEIAEQSHRTAASPDGELAPLEDSLLVLRRLA